MHFGNSHAKCKIFSFIEKKPKNDFLLFRLQISEKVGGKERQD